MMQYLPRPGGKEQASLKSRQGEGKERKKRALGKILSEQNDIDIAYKIKLEYNTTLFFWCKFQPHTLYASRCHKTGCQFWENESDKEEMENDTPSGYYCSPDSVPS